MTNNRKALGAWGESIAAAHLEANGYSILAQNARTPYGEIDILAKTGNLLVFVEVKTRSSGSFGDPEMAVTRAKQAHMIASAEYYLHLHPELDGDLRIDVIAIRHCRQAEPEIVHFKNAVQG